jgi:hypothetical protein
VFASFVSHASRATGGSITGGSSNANAASNAVLGSAITVAKKVTGQSATATSPANPTPDTASHASYVLPMLGLITAAILLLVGERDHFFKKASRKSN